MKTLSIMLGSILFNCLTFVTFSRGQTLKENIYTEIQNIRPCFRRMNSTNVIGCTSEKGGNVGVLMYVETLADFHRLRELEEFAPFIILVDPYLFNADLLHTFKSSGLVTGVLLPGIKDGRWKDHYPKEGYSDDSKCPSSSLPNNHAPCPAQSPWNAVGSGTMWENWGFPIFLLENSTFTEQIHSCYTTHNTGPALAWPLCALELTSNMYAAQDSATCLRRSALFSISPVTVCDPLSDENLHYFVRPRDPASSPQPEEDGSVLVVTARLDALSMFDQVETGFDSPSSGIVTLLAVANIVTQKMKTLSFTGGIKNILFFLIHGESFDFIGSTRLVHDMAQDSFPFNISAEEAREKFPNGSQLPFQLSSIHSVLEVGQVASQGQDTALHLHTRNSPAAVTAALLAHKGQLRVSEAADSLPPTSAVSFLAARPDIPSVVVTNYRDQFTNKMYHSVYDTAARAGYNYTEGSENSGAVRHLAAVADMVAAAVLDLATDERVAADSGDTRRLVNELLRCYTLTSDCGLFYRASSPDNFPWIFSPEARGGSPFPQYVGVRSSYHTLMTRQVLQLLTGDTVTVAADTAGGGEEAGADIAEEMKACRDLNNDQNIYRYVYVVKDEDCYNVTQVRCGSCLRTTVVATPALSPAMDHWQDWGEDTPQFPTWTESIWKTIGARMFLKGSTAFDQGIFSLGIIVFCISFVTTYWLNKHASIIFQTGTAIEIDNPVPVEM